MDAPVSWNLMKTLLAFSGSTRKDSFNSQVIRALPGLAPAGTTIVQFDVTDLPFYNQDLEGDAQPDIVLALRAAVAEADGVIIAGPEYNHTFSAVTKNLIDWASRPFGAGAIIKKNSMVIVAGPGPGGGTHCIEAMSHLMGLLGGTVVASVGVAAAHEKISDDTVIDDALAAELATGLAAF
jgi:chromate reductase